MIARLSLWQVDYCGLCVWCVYAQLVFIPMSSEAGHWLVKLQLYFVKVGNYLITTTTESEYYSTGFLLWPLIAQFIRHSPVDLWLPGCGVADSVIGSPGLKLA